MEDDINPQLILSETNEEKTLELEPNNEKLDNVNMEKPVPFWRLFLIFVCCYLTNLAILFGKGSFSVGVAAMVYEKILNKEQSGLLFGAGSIAYCLGNYFIGIPMDKIGPRYTFIILIVVLILCLIGFIFSFNFWILGVLYICYSFFNSGNWPAMAKLIKNWVTTKQYAKSYGILSTSSQFGRVFSLLFLGFLVSRGMRFYYGYLIAASFLILMLLIDIIFLRSKPFDIGYSPPKEPGEEHKEHILDNAGYKEALIYFFSSFKVWLGILYCFFSGISMEIFYFLPIFLTETQNIDPGIASISTSSFSFGCAISVFIMGFLYDKISPLFRFIIISIQLLIAIICNLIIFYFYQKLNIFITVFIILTIGICYSPPHYIPAGVFVSGFGGKYTGTLFTIIEGPGLIGAVVFDMMAGFILERFGWTLFFLILNINGIFLLVFTSSFLFVLYKGPLNK